MATHFDLVIRGGSIIDGSGGAPFAGDLAISDGRIREIGSVEGRGREEIDAGDKWVVPGFVDIHTHYDGQATWENRLRPSSEHGVTTVVMGNCGVGFAPCRPEERELLVKVMEGVEDIPEIVLTEGVPWEWQTFPEYLRFLSTRSYDADIAAYLPHGAVRVFVMGQRAAKREPSTPEDRERMAQLVTEAVRAGAVGVSTSRSLSHLDSDGNLAPHVRSAREELLALGRGLRDAGRGVFQLAAGLTGKQLESVMPGAGGRTMEEAMREEISLYSEICRASGRPLTFSLAGVNDEPMMVRDVLNLVAEANEQPGVRIMPQVFPRPIGILFGLELSLHPFKSHPSYRAIENLPLDARVARMRRPEVRARILSERPDPDHPNALHRFLITRSLDAYPCSDPVDYEPDPGTSLKAIAAAERRSVYEVAYDALLERDGRALLYLPVNNFAGGNLDGVHAMISSEDTLLGLGDGGAHYGFICDASFPAFLLTYWVRDRRKGNGRRVSLPDAVHRLTRKSALALGLDDRGLLAAGMKADLNIIDHENLRLGVPEVAFDLPGGGRRLSQKVSGIEATVVSGQVVYRDGIATGSLPGRLLAPKRPG